MRGIAGAVIYQCNDFCRNRLMLDKLDIKPGKAIDPAVLSRFAAIVGDKYAITDPAAQTPYLVEMRDLFRGTSPMVLRRERSPKGIAKDCVHTWNR